MIQTRNKEAGFTEWVNEDVPTITRELDGRAAVLLDMQTRNVVGYRVYDSPTPETADIAGLVERYISRARELSDDGKLTWWSGLADLLQSLSAELAEARVRLATMTHQFEYEAKKHSDWLERFMAEEARATTAEAQARAMREALEELVDTLTPASYPAMKDPAHHDEIKRLGDRIGYGALMAGASAAWREATPHKGSEFVAGPCYSVLKADYDRAVAALAREGK